MDKDKISKYRADVIENFINIETLINAIICQRYLKKVTMDFYYEVLYDEYFSFGLKRRILEKICKDIDSPKLQDLNRLNTIRNYFAHYNQEFFEALDKEKKTGKVKVKYEAKGKPLTEAGLMRVASYELTDYWVKQRPVTTWLDCGNCSKKQRRKCREELLYEQCPKFHQLVSLNAVVGDGDGHKTELMDFVADDKAVDLDAWLDARRILQGLPRRLVLIAYKL